MQLPDDDTLTTLERLAALRIHTGATVALSDAIAAYLDRAISHFEPAAKPFAWADWLRAVLYDGGVRSTPADEAELREMLVPLIRKGLETHTEPASEPNGPKVGDKIERWSQVPPSVVVLDTDNDPWQFCADYSFRIIDKEHGGRFLPRPQPNDNEERYCTPLTIAAVGVPDDATPEDVRRLVAQFVAARG